MIRGLGIDIVHISRLSKWRKTPGLMERFFHPEELEAARRRGSGMETSLAARFAAKEAFGKALGTGLHGITLKDIKVKNNHNGKPEIHLYGTAQAALDRMGGGTLFLSLTHEKDNAVAVVVIEE